MKEWHHVNSKKAKGRGLRKVRRRSHTVAKSEFSVNMHDESTSVREVTGQRVHLDEFVDNNNKKPKGKRPQAPSDPTCCELCILL